MHLDNLVVIRSKRKKAYGCDKCRKTFEKNEIIAVDKYTRDRRVYCAACVLVEAKGEEEKILQLIVRKKDGIQTLREPIGLEDTKETLRVAGIDQSLINTNCSVCHTPITPYLQHYFMNDRYEESPLICTSCLIKIVEEQIQKLESHDLNRWLKMQADLQLGLVPYKHLKEVRR